MSTLERAIEIAVGAHRGKTDDGGTPADLYAANHTWADTVTYADFGATAGAQAGEDYDAPSFGQATGGTAGENTRLEHSVNVTPAVVAWS